VTFASVVCAVLGGAAVSVLVPPSPRRLLLGRQMTPRAGRRATPGFGAPGMRRRPAGQAPSAGEESAQRSAAMRRLARAGREAWRARSRASRRRAEVIELCTAVGAELRGGAMPADALVTAVESLPGRWDELGRVVALGGDAVAALRAAGAQPGCGGLSRLAACWAVTEMTGAGLADGCERVAAWLRDEEALRREVAAQLAGARSSARLLTVLPLFGLALGSGMGGDPIAFLLGTPYGVACLAGGVTLVLAGLWWTERLVRSVEARI